MPTLSANFFNIPEGDTRFFMILFTGIALLVLVPAAIFIIKSRKNTRRATLRDLLEKQGFHGHSLALVISAAKTFDNPFMVLTKKSELKAELARRKVADNVVEQITRMLYYSD